MPFVRTIYILLARESQRKPWMDAEGVRVVYHRDFIPERFLPTFGLTFEMFLHKIPGLSGRFIYGNDDMFPLSPLTEKDFFEDDVPCLRHAEKPFPESPGIFHLFCLNGLNFVAREFGKRFGKTWLKGGHSLTPMLKSTWEYLWNIGSEDIEASITPFRDSCNFNQWICPWWHYLAGNYIDRVPKRVYVSTRNSVSEVAAALSADDPGIVCVNDNECVHDYMQYGSVVRQCIEKRLEL